MFAALSMAYIVVVGYWDESMNTLSLVALSVPLSIAFGLLVGVAAFKSRVRIALPSAYPYRKAMISMAGCIAAQGP